LLVANKLLLDISRLQTHEQDNNGREYLDQRDEYDLDSERTVVWAQRTLEGEAEDNAVEHPDQHNHERDHNPVQQYLSRLSSLFVSVRS